jgi:hypothetical protein
VITVLLNTGLEVLIDPQDIWVLAYKWNVRLKNGVPYPSNNELGYLHRAILGVTDPKVLVDHKDGNTLDCRRANLREASRTVNRRNSPKHRGYHFHGPIGKWNAYISVNGKRRSLGYFATEDEARDARLAAEREAWGIEPARAHLHG